MNYPLRIWDLTTMSRLLDSPVSAGTTFKSSLKTRSVCAGLPQIRLDGTPKVRHEPFHPKFDPGNPVLPGFTERQVTRPVVVLDSIAGHNGTGPIAAMQTMDEGGVGKTFEQGQNLTDLLF